MDDRVEALVASLHMEHCESGDGMHKVIRAAVIAALELAAEVAEHSCPSCTESWCVAHQSALVAQNIRALARGGGGDK